MKQTIIDGVKRYAEAVREERENKTGKEVYMWDFFEDDDILYSLKMHESKEIDQAVDFLVEDGCYEIMDLFFEKESMRYSKVWFRNTSDRWEHGFPKLLDYLEDKMLTKGFVEFLGQGYRESYFDIKSLVDNFENAKKYAYRSILCAQKMYENTSKNIYLEAAKALALRKLLGRIIIECSTMVKKSGKRETLADHVYDIVKSRLHFEKVLLLDEETLDVKLRYGTMDDMYEMMKKKIHKIYKRQTFKSLYGEVYGAELETVWTNENHIESQDIELINNVGVELGIFEKMKRKKFQNTNLPLEDEDISFDCLEMDDDEILCHMAFGFKDTRFSSVRNHIGSQMMELGRQKRMGEIIRRMEPAYETLCQYQPTSEHKYIIKYDMLMAAIKNFDFEENRIKLPKSKETYVICDLFNIIRSSSGKACGMEEVNSVMIDCFDDMENLVTHSHCNDSIYMWVIKNHIDKLYDYIRTSNESDMDKIFKMLKDDAKSVAYLMASKAKKLRKRVKEAIFMLENPLESLDIDPIDKKHEKILEELKTEYHIITGDDSANAVNKLASKKIRATTLKKYDWVNIDSADIRIDNTPLTKEGFIYLYRMIEDSVVYKLPIIYDRILSRIQSDSPLKTYEALMESYKAEGFTKNNRFILYFCKVLLDGSTLYRFNEDIKDQELDAPVAEVYMDAYKFKSTGSEMEILIDLKLNSKNKGIASMAEGYIKNIRRRDNISILDINKMEVHAGRMAGKGKAELKKAEKKLSSYLENAFMFDNAFSRKEIQRLMDHPMAGKFMHSLFFKSNESVFTIDESNEFVDINYDTVALAEDDEIRIVSNLELERSSMDKIEEYIKDNKMESHIDQFGLEDIKINERYSIEEREVHYLSVNNKLEEMGFILDYETYILDLGDGLKVTMYAYLEGVTTTYKMDIGPVYIQGDIEKIENARKIRRVINRMMKSGIDIKK